MKLRQSKLDPRQVLIQKLLAADRRGIINVSKFGECLFGVSSDNVGVFKTKPEIKGKHHRRRLSDHVPVAPSGEIYKHVGQSRIVRGLLVQVTVRVFAESDYVRRASLEGLGHSFQPRLELRRLAHRFAKRIKNLMRIKRQHQNRNRVSVLKPQ